MNDFRIKVFLSVVENLSFTKASAELDISQPAISNHIKEIETMYNVQLFQRTKNSITLTSQGRLFLRYAKEIDWKYEELEFQMNLAEGNTAGELVIGASATIADYILPSMMASYMSNFPNVKLSLVRGNTKQIEKLVSEHRVGIGLIEGIVDEPETEIEQSVQPSLFANDELVLVKSFDNKKIGTEISVEELTKIPLVLSENGSDTLSTVLEVLKYEGIEYSDLNVQVQLDSTESIKRFISNGESYAIVPISAIASELLKNELSIVEVVDLKFYREFLFIFPSYNSQSDSQVDSQNELAEKFASFVKCAYKVILT